MQAMTDSFNNENTVSRIYLVIGEEVKDFFATSCNGE